MTALAPGNDVQSLLKTARWPDAGEPVLIVGHQPTLGFAAAVLLADQMQPWAIKKGGVWWLRSRDREGSAGIVLHAVQSPDSL